MNDQLPLFNPTTCEDTPNAISSPASGSGLTPCDSPGGPTTAKSGPDHVPASRSARPVKAKRSTTKGIYGQSSFDSSRHEDLSFALASRLRPLTDSLGSTLFSLTWMTRITPAGQSISALRASEPLTEGSVFIGWPTPTVEDYKDDGPKVAERMASGDWRTCDQRLRSLAKLAGWLTTRAEDAESSGMRRSRGIADTMTAVASLTAWGTPAARDWKSGDASQETLDKNARPLNELAMLTARKTPCVPNGGRGPHLDGKTKDQIGLENEAKLSGWATPNAHERPRTVENWRENSARLKANNPNLGELQFQLSSETLLCEWTVDQSTDSGPGPIGFLLGPNGWETRPASGQLNAAHSRWLMGLPPAWDDCGVTAMASSRKRPKRL